MRTRYRCINGERFEDAKEKALIRQRMKMLREAAEGRYNSGAIPLRHFHSATRVANDPTVCSASGMENATEDGILHCHVAAHMPDEGASSI